MHARIALATTFAGLLAGCAISTGPGNAPAPRPLVPVMEASTVGARCDAGLAAARADVAKLREGADAGAFFAEWNRLQVAIQDFIGPIAMQNNLHPDKAVRDAGEPCLQKYTAFISEMYQDEKLYARVQAAKPADAREEKLLRDVRNAFEDRGVTLPPDKRARAREIFARVEQLRQEFERNIRDDATTVAFTEAEARGVPESFLKSRKRDAQGRYVFGTDDAAYTVFMANAADGEARKKYYFARMNKGGARNLQVMEEAYRQRKELAALYGLPSFAHYATRRRMAGTPDAVNKFLADVRGAVESVERDEMRELQAVKAQATGNPQARLERWDSAYYQEQVRRTRYAVDQERLRKHFPTPKAVDYALLVAETLYGVRFRADTVPTWHPDVRYYDVLDAASGRYVAGIYLDLYPREGKRNGAWASPVRGVSRAIGRTPISVLATNFNREGLDAREMETLFHEFGHVLHGVLSTAKYVSQAGTSVKSDFVEAPSQMFEEWVRREEALALFRKVCPECPALTKDEIARLEAARRFGQGGRYARQLMYATFDMTLATEPQDVLQAWKTLERATPMGHVEGTIQPASFPHLVASNYAGGYYGYMWSEVLALDMLSPFNGRMLDPQVGARYRDLILARGSEEEEMSAVRKFLGRDPSPQAFFAEITGKR